MNYAQIRKFDIANGIGIRTTLFVSGCTHHCPGCFNLDYQDFNYGVKWDDVAEEELLSYVADCNVQGVTILGGEPLDQIMDTDLLNLLKKIKRETGKSIWLYSGYVIEAILQNPKQREIIACCDVLVDGPFIEAEKDITLRFRGSENQRILDVAESLAQEKPVLLDLN